MSRVNILAKFKIRSLLDSYYMVGTSEFGEFTKKLGTGRELVSGNISSLVEGEELKDAAAESGVEVHVPVSLGENYGNFMIRLYAQNELGIRSPYIEFEKNILPADISGSFRFGSLDVAGIAINKPKFDFKVKKKPSKTNNFYIKESEFIGESFKLDFSLKANSKLSGSKSGEVSQDNPMFSNFEIKFYKEYIPSKIVANTNTPEFDIDEVLKTKLDIPPDFIYSEEKLDNFTDFSIFLNKSEINKLYDYNNVTGQDRKVYIKITGYDVFYNVDRDANGDPKDDHKFCGVGIIEQKIPELDFGRFELYGQTFEAEVRESDPDVNLSSLRLIQFRSSEKNAGYNQVRKIPIAGSNVTTAVQEWHSSTNSNYYKYLVEVHDGYGFAGYYSIDGSGRLSALINGDLDSAVIASDYWAAFLEIGNLSIKEVGAKTGEFAGAFRVDWDLVDSSGNIIDISKDVNGSPIYKVKGEYEVDKIEGFTACLVCPDDYTDSSSSFQIRDARDLNYLNPNPSTGEIIGEPTNSKPFGESTIFKTDTQAKADNGMQISESHSFFVTRKQNQNVYRSWFNEHNPSHRKNSFDAKIHDPFRVLYNANYGTTLVPYGLDADEKYVDAQRRIKVRVELIDKQNKTVHLLESQGYNGPPVFQLAKQGEQTLNDLGSTSVNANGELQQLNTSAVIQNPGNVEFQLPANEKIEFVEIFRRPHVKYAAGTPAKFYAELTQNNSDLENQGTHYYNRKFDDFFLDTDKDTNDNEIPNNEARMLFNYGCTKRNGYDNTASYGVGTIVYHLGKTWRSLIGTNIGNEPSEDSDKWVEIDLGDDVQAGGYGFHVRRVAPMGNSANAPLVNGIDIGEVSPTESNMVFQDFPPMMCEDGDVVNTQYDYLIIPFDVFGSGQAEFFENVNVYSPFTYHQDERGVVGILDLDAPKEPESVQIDGTNKTFQLNWSRPLFTNDLDHYNLYYILDNRSKTEMLHGLVGSDPITSGSGADENVINFSIAKHTGRKNEYLHSQSDFLKQDFNFKESGTTDVEEWKSGGSYDTGKIIKHRPGLKGTNKAAYRIYQSLEDNNSGNTPHSDSTKWKALSNMSLYDGRTLVYQDDIVEQTRVTNTSSDSQTFALIFYQADKTYQKGEIAFQKSTGHCYKSIGGSNLNNALSDLNSWRKINNVQITEVEVPASETSVSVIGDTNARGYFYFESVDRAGNRSRLHSDPTDSSSADIRHDLGTSTIRDMESFEQELSEEFPNAIMLRPDNPFEIDQTGSTDRIKWKSHYVYSAGQGYYMPSGSIDLENDLFTNNIERQDTENRTGEIHLTDDQFIRYIYFDRSYGYDLGSTTFKKQAVLNTTIRDIESDRLSAGLEASDVTGKDRDTEIQYSGNYLFCTGNPASNTYNGITTADGLNIIEQDNVDDKIASLNDLIDGQSTTQDYVPAGEEPTNANNGLGTWGVHVQKSDALKNTAVDSLFKKDTTSPGSFQIARIDRFDDNGSFEYNVEVNFETINNATIGQANISNATITSAQVTDLSAEKITAGVIGSHKIEIGNSIVPETQLDGTLKDTQVYQYRKDDQDRNLHLANFITDDAHGQLSTDDANLYSPMLPGLYNTTYQEKNSIVGASYRYGSITSKGFDHNTIGRPGFFISGDGQFGFQTTRGGLYLRDDGTGTPAELVLRGTLVQESSDPFVKIEMSATNQFVSFDEHAGNHYYYGTNFNLDENLEVYGTKTQVVSPSDGRVVIEYDIQNARHVDGSPYTANELQMLVYVDGDPDQPVTGDALLNLIGNSTQAHKRNIYTSSQAWPEGSVVLDGGLSYKANELINANSAGPNNNPDWIRVSVFDSRDLYISKQAYKSLHAEEKAVYETNLSIVEDDDLGLFGLNNLSDINEGGSITLDFVGGHKDFTDKDSSELILFTGQHIQDSNDRTGVETALQELDLILDNEALPSKLIPIAESYTVQIGIKPRVDSWTQDRTYLVGDLVEYQSRSFRCLVKHASSTTDTPPTTDTDNTNWRFVDTNFALDKKKITITRRDKPANLASIILTSDGGNVIRNGDEDAEITIYPLLKYGTEEYDLRLNDNNRPDWINSMRSQLVIFEKPTTVGTGNLAGQLNKTNYIKQAEVTANSPLSHLVKDAVIDGKQTFILVDKIINETVGDVNKADWPGDYKILDEFEVVDLNDGQPAILVKTNTTSDQFITRLLNTQFKAGASTILDGSKLSERYKLQELTKNIACTLEVFLPAGNTEDLTKYTLSFNLEISADIGTYLKKTGLKLKQGSDVIFSGDQTTPTPPVVVTIKDGAITPQEVAKGILEIECDNDEHVSEIKIKARVIQTKNKDISNPTEADDFDNFTGDIFDGELEVYINTAEPIDHSLRLSLFRKLITYSDNQKLDIAELDRPDNIVPIRVNLGTENVTDEFHNESQGISQGTFDIVPSVGHIVDSDFLNGVLKADGSQKGESYSSDKAAAAKAVIKFKQSAANDATENPNFYWDEDNSTWKFLANTENTGVYTEVNKNYLFYLPASQQATASDKVAITVTYTRNSQPFARLDSGDATTPKEFKDTEVLPVAKIFDGKSSVTVSHDNLHAEIPTTSDGAILINVDKDSFTSTTEVFVGTNSACLLPDVIDPGAAGSSYFVVQIPQSKSQKLKWEYRDTSNNPAEISFSKTSEFEFKYNKNGTNAYLRNEGDQYKSAASDMKIKPRKLEPAYTGTNDKISYISMYSADDNQPSPPVEARGSTPQLALYNSGNEIVGWADMPGPMQFGIFNITSPTTAIGIKKYDNANLASPSGGKSLNFGFAFVETNNEIDVNKVEQFMLYDRLTSGDYISSGPGAHNYASWSTAENGDIPAAVRFFTDTSPYEEYFEVNDFLAHPMEVSTFNTVTGWTYDNIVTETFTRKFSARKSGPSGATVTYRGTWDPTETYFGTSARRDIVYHSNQYWLARASSEEHADQQGLVDGQGFDLVDYRNATSDAERISTSLNLSQNYGSFEPSAKSKIWEKFGAQFEAVATNLLIADDAYVKRGVVVGKDNPYDGFFASQLNSDSFTPLAGGVEVHKSSMHGALVEGNNANYGYTILDYTNNQTEYNSLEAHANQSTMRRIETIKGNALQYFRDPDNPDDQTTHYAASTGDSDQAVPIVTTWKLPYIPEPGFFLGYHKTNRCPGDIFSGLKMPDGKDLTLPDALPMLELYSPFGNFFRWNGLRLEMFGSVINGSIYESGSIGITFGANDGIGNVGFQNSAFYGGQIFCGGGVSNFIRDNEDSLCSAIVGGAHNRIVGKMSLIGAGANNFIANHHFSFIGAGYGNLLISTKNGGDAGDVFNSILTGKSNSIIDSSHSFIGSGYGNLINNSDYGSIINGRSNILSSTDKAYDDFKKDDDVSLSAQKEALITTEVQRQNPIADTDINANFNHYATETPDDTILKKINNGENSASLVFFKKNITSNTDPFEDVGESPFAAHNPFSDLRRIVSANDDVDHKWIRYDHSQYSNVSGIDGLPIFVDTKNQFSDGKDIHVIPVFHASGNAHGWFWVGNQPDVSGIKGDIVGWPMYTDRDLFPYFYIPTLAHSYKNGANASDNLGGLVLFRNGAKDTLEVIRAEDLYLSFLGEEPKSIDELFKSATNPTGGNSETLNEMIVGINTGNNLFEPEDTAFDFFKQKFGKRNGSSLGVILQNSGTPPQDVIVMDGQSNKQNFINAIISQNLGIPKTLNNKKFAHNTITGGEFNSIHNSKNSLVLSSNSTKLWGLSSATVGGSGNNITNTASNTFYDTITSFGSDNLFEWSGASADVSADFTNLGSNNTIFNATNSVFLGVANKIVGNLNPADGNHKTIGDVVALNIFGNNNQIVGNALNPNTVSIFGSNFKLTQAEQVQNAFYFGNPYLSGSSGQALTRLFFAADGGAYFTGDVISFALSDINFKENIKTIQAPLDKIRKINGVFFDWKDNQKTYSGRDVGLIAQEVEEILPEVVSSRESGGKAIRYEKIVPLLVECIKDLSSQIQDLKSTINKLEK